MKTLRYETIVESLGRLDAPATEVSRLVDAARQAVRANTHAPKKKSPESKNAAALQKAVAALPVRLVAGKKTNLGTILRDLRETTPSATLKTLTAERFYQTEPFRTLGNLPVATDSGPVVTRLRDVFPVFAHQSGGKLPIGGRSKHSHTYWMYYSNSWWSVGFYNHYSASTHATATGWEAVDILGGEYLVARDACESLIVPPPSDPSAFVIAFLKAAACNYVKTAPEVPFPAMNIQTIVCSCLVKGADGSCNPYVRRGPGRDPELFEDCKLNQGTNTAGPVDATHTSWMGDCLGVTSEHRVDFVQGVTLIQDVC